MSTETVEQVYIPLILERLKPLRPYKLILFGSHAYGDSHAESDIDLMVVLDTDEIPQTFEENLRNKLLVRDALWDLNSDVSIDLIVHTRPMYKKFVDMDSMFAREITQRGKVLYDSAR